MSWYVVITRDEYIDYPKSLETKPMEDVVIGPFEEEEAAISHMEDSADVEDWCYGEAKAKNYTVDDVYVAEDPTFPSYGVNAPILSED